MSGKVYLIGGGPGDPKLMSLKGKEIIERADVVVYDRLAGEMFLSYVSETCEVIYAGKGSTEGGVIQDWINKTLLEKAMDGKIVARLKGGDPFVFGRGGEEALYLAERGIEFEIVPGISALASVPAYAGIPVTHRGASNEIHVYTGKSKDGRIPFDIRKAAENSGTSVIFMGVSGIGEIIQGLIKNSKEKETPIAVIENGTTSAQRVVSGTIGNIEELCIAKGIKPPALIVIGNSVNLREKIKWFSEDRRAIAGKKVVVTRELKSCGSFADSIYELGGKSIIFPLIKIVPLKKLIDISKFNGVMFSSVNGVRAFLDNIDDIRKIAHLRIGAIGEVTAEELIKRKIIPDFRPAKQRVIELFNMAESEFKKGDRVLWVTSDLSDFDFEEEAKRTGINYEKGIFYRTEKVVKESYEIEYIIKEEPDFITFFSSSAVESFFENFGDSDIFEKTKFISIGVETSRRLREFGVNDIIEANKPTANGIIEVIKNECKV
jgi:uroporphyrinogen III methyltransferase / synthase